MNNEKKLRAIREFLRMRARFALFTIAIVLAVAAYDSPHSINVGTTSPTHVLNVASNSPITPAVLTDGALSVTGSVLNGSTATFASAAAVLSNITAHNTNNVGAIRGSPFVTSTTVVSTGTDSTLSIVNGSPGTAVASTSATTNNAYSVTRGSPPATLALGVTDATTVNATTVNDAVSATRGSPTTLIGSASGLAHDAITAARSAPPSAVLAVILTSLVLAAIYLVRRTQRDNWTLATCDGAIGQGLKGRGFVISTA